jgi:hypothetical protein
MENSEWPFDEPKNVAVLTTTGIIQNQEAILYVSHDDDDGAWEFFPSPSVPIDCVILVALHRVFALDKSLMSLADLPLGWVAKRKNINEAWVRSKKVE